MLRKLGPQSQRRHRSQLFSSAGPPLLQRSLTAGSSEDVVRYFNQQTGMNLTPILDQYLRHPAIPVLELKWSETAGTVAYRWKADEPAFQMPVRVGTKDRWLILKPTAEWQTMRTPLGKDEFEVATDLYFVTVSKL